MARARNEPTVVDTGSDAGSPLPVQARLTTTTVRELLLHELEVTASRLGDSRPLSPVEVHATRKRLKRARALLALLRPPLDARDFAACDDAFRAAGKSLAASRDATVLARTYARITKGRRPLPAAMATATSRTAPLTHGRDRAQATDPVNAFRLMRPGLERLRKSTLRGRGWTPLGAGLRTVYRRGRRGMAAAARDFDPSGARLHAWRRRTRRYWHVLEVFEVVNPDGVRPIVAALRRLSHVLGEEHDLALLAAHLDTSAGRRPGVHDVVLREFTERRARLARRALKLGVRIYAARPRELEDHMHRDWRRWRRRRRAIGRQHGADD